jgi:hypothetical protein
MKPNIATLGMHGEASVTQLPIILCWWINCAACSTLGMLRPSCPAHSKPCQFHAETTHRGLDLGHAAVVELDEGLDVNQDVGAGWGG